MAIATLEGPPRQIRARIEDWAETTRAKDDPSASPAQPVRPSATKGSVR
jgi:hypothetical protein